MQKQRVINPCKASIYSRGFSLIEIIVVIVVMSIISIGIVQFIIDSAAGYARTANRSELSAAGRVVIDRISMELHNALPNSVRISPPSPYPSTDTIAFKGDQCIEFVPILSATTYIDPAIRPQARTTTFTVVEFVPDVSGEGTKTISIYPSKSSDIYSADFTGPNTQEAIAGASVSDVSMITGTVTVTTTTNHRFTRSSPSMRAFFTDQPISYCVVGNRLYKYSNYGFSPTQLRPTDIIGGGCTAGTCLPSTTGTGRVLLTSFLDNADFTAFSEISANRRRNSVIQLELNFSQDGDEVLLNHEVFLHSAP